MACVLLQQWCCFDQRQQQQRRRAQRASFNKKKELLLELIFLICVLGPTVVVAVRDDASYYSYGLLSSNPADESRLIDDHTQFSFVSERSSNDDNLLVRRRRATASSASSSSSSSPPPPPAAAAAATAAVAAVATTENPINNSQIKQPNGTTSYDETSSTTTLEPSSSTTSAVPDATSTEATTFQGVKTKVENNPQQQQGTTKQTQQQQQQEQQQTQTQQINTNKSKVVVSTPMNPSTGHPVSTDMESVSNNKTTVDSKNATIKSEQKNQTDISDMATIKGSETSPNDSKTGNEDDDDDELPDMNLNKTLSQSNMTMREDEHQYYNSTFIVDEAIAKKYWVDLDNHPELRVNDLLSKSHRRAATVKLKFDFPFYGHKVRNITIATGGFLYTGDYVHNWLAATQYIAPLMANFDTRLSNESYVKYADNGTSFTVEWEKVVLQDKEHDGAFTFQVTLFQNGDIVFVYSVIPFILDQMKEAAHPVKVGLSDAYIMDRTVFFVRRKTIYEYHRVNFNRQDLTNWTVIYLRALPTCLDMTNCTDCLTKDTKFDCKWCPELNQCSTGTFRSRQDWLLKGCDERNIKEINNCPAATYKQYIKSLDDQRSPFTDEDTSGTGESAIKKKPGTSPLEHPRDNVNMSVSGIIGILLVITLVGGLGAWATYAYRNPHSASGQMLIRYRPSQWSWRRGEARYTAATIHM